MVGIELVFEGKVCLTHCPLWNQSVDLFTLDFAQILELTQFGALYRPTWIPPMDSSVMGGCPVGISGYRFQAVVRARP